MSKPLYEQGIGTPDDGGAIMVYGIGPRDGRVMIEIESDTMSLAHCRLNASEVDTLIATLTDARNRVLENSKPRIVEGGGAC